VPIAPAQHEFDETKERFGTTNNTVNRMLIDLPAISLVLSIGAVLSPVFYGYLIFKMSDRFTTKSEFADYKIRADSDRQELKSGLIEINHDIKTLLQK
jgi:hypothetical protein